MEYYERVFIRFVKKMLKIVDHFWFIDCVQPFWPAAHLFIAAAQMIILVNELALTLAVFKVFTLRKKPKQIQNTSKFECQFVRKSQLQGI